MRLKILLTFVCLALMASTTLSITSFEEEEENEEEFELDATAGSFNDDEDDENILPEIEIENQKIFEDFVNKELGKIDYRLSEMEMYFRKYYLRTDASDELDDIYYEISFQQNIVKTTKEIISNQKKISSLKKFKFKNFVTEHGKIFKKVLQKLKESVIRVEKSLAKMKRLGNFEKISSLLEEQHYSIQLLEDVIENPSKIPKQSHLLRERHSSTELNNATNEYYDGISRMSVDDDEIYGFVGDQNEVVNLTIFGSNTQKPLGIIAAPKNKFIKEIPKIFQHPKFTSIIIQIDTFENHQTYVKSVREKLYSVNIPYIFLWTPTYMHSSIMAKAGVEVEPGESVVVVLVNENRYIVTEFKYTIQGYLEDSKTRDCDDIKKMKHEEIEKRIIGPNNPAKIILHSNTPYLSEMNLLKQKILKKHSKKLIILEEAWENYDSIFITETAKHLLDNSYAKYHILPVSMQNYIIGFECGGKKVPLIVCKKDSIVPFKKTIMVPKSPQKYFVNLVKNFLLVLMKRNLNSLKKLQEGLNQLAIRLFTISFKQWQNHYQKHLDIQLHQILRIPFYLNTQILMEEKRLKLPFQLCRNC